MSSISEFVRREQAYPMLFWIYADVPDEVIICNDCFSYSRYPEQWKRYTDIRLVKCNSCGRYHRNDFISMAQPIPDNAQGD